MHAPTSDFVEYLPTVHLVQILAPLLVPVLVIYPGAQTAHDATLELVEYLPAAHSSHVVAPALMPVLVIEPARHALQ